MAGHRFNRKAVIIFLLAGAALLEILIYINVRCLSLARERVANDQKRLSILKTAQKSFPLNEGVFLELGRWWMDHAQVPRLSAGEKTARMRRAMDYFIQALKLNPGSYQAHFYLAQVGQFLRFWEDIPFDPVDELKKAAALTTFDEEAYYQAGRSLFGLWGELSTEDRELTLKLLANVITPATPERLTEILPLWEYNGAVDEVIERLLPQDARMYRLLADYLARRGIKHKLRLVKLAQAEKMEFDRARRFYSRGIERTKIGQFRRGEQYFQEAQGLLRGIKFYQSLIGEQLIEEEEYLTLRKELSKNLALLKLSKGEELASVRFYLEEYLILEDNLSSLKKFIDLIHQRIKNQGIDETKTEDEFLVFFLETLVDYKKGAYREIIDKITTRAGSILDNLVRFPTEVAEMWRIMAESYLKLDYLYDSLEYFERAREIKPEDLGILLGLKKAYERLNREDKWTEINLLITQIIQKKNEAFKPVILSPGKPRRFSVLADNPTTRLKFVFEFQNSIRPLLAISVNGRVIKELFLTNQELEVAPGFQMGENLVEIISFNTEIKCSRIIVQVKN
jgi:tetratricopeptide (TPR) repeat protein